MKLFAKLKRIFWRTRALVPGTHAANELQRIKMKHERAAAARAPYEALAERRRQRQQDN